MPLPLLFDRSLTAENVDLNLHAIEILGQICEGEDEELDDFYTQVEAPWSQIIINFIKPYINIMGKQKDFEPEKPDEKNTISY